MDDGCQATDTQWDLHNVVAMHNVMTMVNCRQWSYHRQWIFIDNGLSQTMVDDKQWIVADN